MPRDHVEYVHHSEIGWEPCDVSGLPNGSEEKVLSEDHETGASTRQIRLTDERRDPVGDPLAWNAPVEILVLDGEFWLGSDVLHRFDYAYVPTGATAARFGVPDEATILFMNEAELEPSDPADDAEIDIKYTSEMEWEDVSKYASSEWDTVGAGMKILHYDEETGERSWLLASLPQRDGFGVELHPVAEEAYQLLGAINGDRGTFDAGSYFWRPPDVPHGPFGNDIGSMTFFRVIGGPLETEYVVTADEL
jgi:hypothetical protein